MFSKIFSAFTDHPEEGAVVGRLLACYGELEFELFNCLGAALDDQSTALKVMFQSRGEEQKILVASALVVPSFAKHGLREPMQEAIADMSFCRLIRNQYAHCHWHEDASGGLVYFEMERTAKTAMADKIEMRPVTLLLLCEQENYFAHVFDCLSYLWREHDVRTGKRDSNDATLPKKIARPLRHGGADA